MFDDGHPIDEILTQIITLAERFNYEAKHSHQSTHLALRIFDLMADVHRLDDECRDLLHLDLPPAKSLS